MTFKSNKFSQRPGHKFDRQAFLVSILGCPEHKVDEAKTHCVTQLINLLSGIEVASGNMVPKNGPKLKKRRKMTNLISNCWDLI